MIEKEEKKSITSFCDVEIYQNSYRACIEVMTKIISELPDSEKYDLRNQLSRSAKAIPRLIAEGYAKRHQKQGFQKYIDGAMGECNEIIVRIEMYRDIYGEYIDKNLWQEPINIYMTFVGDNCVDYVKHGESFSEVKRDNMIEN